MASSELQAPRVLTLYSSLGADVWQRTDNTWTEIDSPEDLALPPILAWTDEHKAVVERQYNEKWARFLDQGQHYEISWPPTGCLTTGGDWCFHYGEDCSEHGGDYDDDCEECQEIDHSEVLIAAPAKWSWSVTVGTYEANESGGSLVASEDYELLVTESDPRDVEYGPPKGSAGRYSLAEDVERLRTSH